MMDLHPIQIFLVASCYYRNRDKLRPDAPFVLHADFRKSGKNMLKLTSYFVFNKMCSFGKFPSPSHCKVLTRGVKVI